MLRPVQRAVWSWDITKLKGPAKLIYFYLYVILDIFSVLAYLAHPERFVNGPPRRQSLPPAVWINPPEKTTHQDGSEATIVAVDDPEVVPACSSYGQSHNLGVTPRELAAASETTH